MYLCDITNVFEKFDGAPLDGASNIYREEYLYYNINIFLMLLDSYNLIWIHF